MSTLSNSQSAMLAQLISSYLNDETKVHGSLPFVMDALVTRCLLKDQEEESEQLSSVRRKWTIRLNSLIQSKQATARWTAIVLIKLTCEQSNSLLFAHIRSWTSQLLGVIAKPETSMIHKAAIETLSYLFTFTSSKPELQREITIPNLPRFNQILLSLCKNDLRPVVFSALKENIIHFPSQSRHIIDHCLKLCLSCLDGSGNFDKDTILAACQCLAVLHHTGGKISNSDQWEETLNRLVGTIHACLNRLFDTVDEELELGELSPSYPMTDLSPDPIESFPLITRRIQALNNAIATCLSSPTLNLVSVPVVQLVDLVCRIYNAFEGSLMREFKDKNEFTCLMMCLPTLHLSANKIVSALLLSSGCHLSRYTKLFSRIFIRLLNEYKTQRTMKISVYNNITLCLQQFGYGFGESIGKPLVASVLKDILVTEQKVTDMIPTEVKNKSMKRKRDALTNSDSLTAIGTSTQAPFDIQVAALESLQQLINCFGSSMDLQSRNTIDANVISRLLSMTQKTLGSTTENELLIKEKLYQCLLSSVMNPIEVQANVLPHAIRIFSAGINEQNHKLQTICKYGLNICDLIIHPRMPPIQSTMNTITTKINQAEQQNDKTMKSSVNTSTSSYPTTTDTITANISQKVDSTNSNISMPKPSYPATTSIVGQQFNGTNIQVAETIKQVTTNPSDIEQSVGASNGKLEQNDIEKTASKSMVTETIENVEQSITSTSSSIVLDEEVIEEKKLSTSEIKFDIDDEMNQDETEITMTTKQTDMNDKGGSIELNSSTATNQDKTISTSNTITIEDDSDGEYDVDMAIPDIDMTGPDTDEEEEY
ncbi:rRNA processing/ribosome biogenesis-domain-containing protein [Halteromyces radiatus]|uniref:rRNA processing/ribosome biogenesis-domain-containing protein n=1 Tax=Halteromyces radiatus TaxID=101107 RepID=UPI002220D0D3|nr:rRNA processing/ribosome biogenesis-domain-containing protein [Halteromyces radiatus]KAI8096725.1 rRNA processing/ribosome biogenesis-domain-containing protein [Halteromyces radiatus]